MHAICHKFPFQSHKFVQNFNAEFLLKIKSIAADIIGCKFIFLKIIVS